MSDTIENFIRIGTRYYRIGYRTRQMDGELKQIFLIEDWNKGEIKQDFLNEDFREIERYDSPELLPSTKNIISRDFS